MELSKEAKEFISNQIESDYEYYVYKIKEIVKNRFLPIKSKIEIKQNLQKKIDICKEIQKYLIGD